VSSPGYGEQTGHKKKELFTMKIFSANIEDLRTLYISDLKKAFDMEQKITDALPTMIDKSTDPQLATAFRDHLRQTEGHVASVEGLLRRAAAQSDRRC
jgi:ferritin-like metal-binding protein YciE